MTMVLITIVLTSTIATWGQPDLTLMFHTIIGTVLVAGSASVFKSVVGTLVGCKDASNRGSPIAGGRLGTVETAVIGLIAVLVGLAYLLNATNSRTAFGRP